MGNVYLIVRALYTGLFTGIIIAIPMGPAGIESVRWTISKGFRQGVLVAAGSLITDTIDVMLINFGLLGLVEKNKLLGIFFWLLSGIIIFYVGYRSIKDGKDLNPEKQDEIIRKKEIKSHPVFTGFIINISNPMTHFFWITLSSTVISIWRRAGLLPYFLFAVSMLSGMFISLFGINYFASRGRKVVAPDLSRKFTKILSYGILAIGIGFFINGLYRLYLYLR